jgi:hypothetical protein
LTVFDFVEGLRRTVETNRSILLARLEVRNFIREIGLIEDYAELEDERFDEIEHLSRLCELALTSSPGSPDQELPMAGPPPPAPPMAPPDSPLSVPANIPSVTGAPPDAPAIDSPEYPAHHSPAPLA